MTTEELTTLAVEARLHADNLTADIRNATTRIEHMRITRLAVEADTLARNFESMLAIYGRNG